MSEAPNVKDNLNSVVIPQYKKIIENPEVLACIRLFATRIKTEFYCDVHEFFDNLHSMDLFTLVNTGANLNHPNEELCENAIHNYMLLTALMLHGEGKTDVTVKEVMDKVEETAGLMAIEYGVRTNRVVIPDRTKYSLANFEEFRKYLQSLQHPLEPLDTKKEND